MRAPGRTLLGLVGAFAIAAVSLAAFQAPRSIEQESESAMASAPTDPQSEIQFSIVLKLPGRDAMTRFLSDLADPASPDYRRYLQPAEFGRRFGLSDADIERVEGWLRDAGLEVVRRDPERTSLSIRGRVDRVNTLLGVRMLDHVDSEYGPYHAPDRAPQIASAVASVVDGVSGLDTTPNMRPLFRPPIADIPARGLDPTGVALAYDIAPLRAAGFDASGQTVAIVSFDTFLPSDVAAYDAEVGISAPPVEQVFVPTDFEPTRGRGTGEVNLDIDVIRSVAPGATIIDYEGANGQGFAPMMSAILEDARADIVSISWGRCEVDKDPVTRRFDDAQFDLAFSRGITVFVASGDLGAYGCNGNRFDGDLRVSVDYPSANPSLVSVGGTFLWVRDDGSYFDEVAWEGSLSAVGTGGGRSINYSRPTWQKGAGVDTSSGAPRQIPDVAGPADPESGFLTVYTPIGGSAPELNVQGGTSAAAPFWAGSMLLVRQVAEQQGVGPLGALSPLLYELAAARPSDPPIFHDISRGGNLIDAAGPGWDPATGLGTPDVTALANAIVAALASE